MPQQRDQHGRFAKGNRGGPGRPKKVHELAYTLAIQDVIGLPEWCEILERTRLLALSGDKDARKFFADYLLGRPGATPRPEDTSPSPGET